MKLYRSSCAPLALVFALAASQVPGLSAPTTDRNAAPRDAEALLLRYQVALDQVALGHLREARVILDDSIRRYGNSPECNLLLTYLLQREGRADEARDRAAAVADNSPLAAAWTTQLMGSRPTTAIGTTTTTAVAATAERIDGTLTRLAQADARLTKMELLMAQMVNDERRKAGLRTLEFDDTLADTARAHSAEMRDRKYFAHESPTPSLRAPLDRYLAVFHKTPSVVAENIYSSWGSPRTLSESDIRSGHTALMNSPGHRANILYPDVSRIGIGITTSASGDLWITQMFSRPQ